MATLNLKAFSEHLGAMNFSSLFTQVLGWNNPPSSGRRWRDNVVKDCDYQSRIVAELAGVAVLEIVAGTGWPDETQRMAIWRQVSQSHYENLLIFLDQPDFPTQSLWYWVKRTKDVEAGKHRNIPRRHEYFRGQPVDLFASKLHALVVELSELDASGRLPVLEVARRMEAALDVEKTTKRFFTRYQEQHQTLLDAIEGVDDERDRRWYASVILNRLMFVWFLQKKLFLDNGNAEYLDIKLTESKMRGLNRFYAEFLNGLFFDAFAKPENQRSEETKRLTGNIPYLNGGLFLPHKLELDEQHEIRIGKTLNIMDDAFEGVFDVFRAFSWSLDDTPGGQSDEINPDVLGYIFEKYINQKAFGAYYTRPEITGYLAERSIHQLILERINEPAQPALSWPAVLFENVADLLAHMDARIALKLVNEVLPSITILDPAVGSGAFLVAALKALINVYYAVVGRAELGASAELQHWLKGIQQDHPSVGYYIKRKIVTDNLYGADIMEEACEIAKLRLFLAMVSSVREVEHLEPLPNIDFNIIPGNSLVGLMRVDEHEFDKRNTQGDLFKPGYRQLLEEKNRKLDTYRHNAGLFGQGANLQALRDDIDETMAAAQGTLNELLRDQFEALGVKYEQATWDATKQDLGKPIKRKIKVEDIAEQTPMHWGYVFDQIMHQRGGFDIVLTNPPWEIFKPQAKEFFADHSELVSKNKMTIKEFEKEQGKLLKEKAVRDAWLAYESRFPHLSAYFRASPDYRYQSAIVGGKKTGSDINLYKLFTERVYSLLRPGGYCGIVIPSGIYTDLGAKGLRDLLFDHTHIKGLFCFENRKEIFEGVHRSFKFVVLTFEKSPHPSPLPGGEGIKLPSPSGRGAGGEGEVSGTTRFPAAFMRHDVAELDRFPAEGALELDVVLIRRLSPDSHSVMEFKSAQDVQIAEKMLRFPLLGEEIEGAWNVGFTAEFHMTNDGKNLFKTGPEAGRLPLYEGKMIWQFEVGYEKPRYWVGEKNGRKAILGRRIDEGQMLDYQAYRLGFRDIAANTNERTMVSTLIPPTFHGNKLPTVKVFDEDGNRLASNETQLFLCAVWNSFVIDWVLRQKVTTTLNFFYLYQLPIPRLTGADSIFSPIVERAARLICTTPEFDDLAKEVGIKPLTPSPTPASGRGEQYGVTHPVERARLRAELDGLIAHLYGLTEAEFAHILTTFPLVPDPVKLAALNAYSNAKAGLIK